MLQLIFELDLWQALLFILILIAINIIFDFIVKWIVESRYCNTGTVENSLYLLSRILRYGGRALLLFTVFAATLVLMPHAEEYAGENSIYLILVVIYIIVILLRVANQMIFFDLGQRLRGTSLNRWEQVSKLVIMLVVSIAAVLLFVFVSTILTEGIEGSGLGNRVFKWGIIALIYVILTLFLPLLNKFLLRAVPMKESELRGRLMEFIKESGIGKASLYVWPVKKNKHANAMVSGFIKREIFISDYLIEKFSVNEIKSVLAHEIGHIVKKHLWIRLAMAAGVFLIIPFILEFVEGINVKSADLIFLLHIGVYILAAFLYFGVFKHYISKRHESQADSYAFNLGVRPQDYISALYKLARLNHVVMRFGKLDEKFQTHPSIAGRINWIMEKGNVPDEEFEEIRKRVDEKFGSDK